MDSSDQEGCLFISLEDKLYRNRYEVDEGNPHIKMREEVCQGCERRICLYICPAKVYVQKADDPERVIANYQNCLECGTCRLACEREGIEWSFPRGGKGIKYRFG
jgi:ferredoxin like protein